MSKGFLIFCLLFGLALYMIVRREAQSDVRRQTQEARASAVDNVANMTPGDAQAFRSRVAWILALNGQMPAQGVDASAKYIEGSQGKRLWVSGPAVNRIFAYQFIHEFRKELLRLAFSEVTFYGDKAFLYDVSTNMLKEN